MNNVINQIDGFYNNNSYYTDTDSLYIHKNHWSTLVEKGFVGKSLGLGINDYGDSGLFYAWFLAPKLKYCLVIDDFGIISAKTTFKGYSEEHRMIQLEEYISLSEGKLYQVDFQLIGLKYLKEEKYLIENKIVQNVIIEKFVVIVLLNLKRIVSIARWKKLVSHV